MLSKKALDGDSDQKLELGEEIFENCYRCEGPLEKIEGEEGRTHCPKCNLNFGPALFI